MEEFSDKELFRVRILFVDLIKSFFQEEPDAENLSRWRGTFSALAREQVSPEFDNAVRELFRLLDEKSLTDIKTEYYDLFINPFGESQINTMASFYLDGRSFGKTLIDLRSFLAEAGLEREEGVIDSEDSLVMLLDTFLRLIEEEKNGGGSLVQQRQATLLTEYLDPFSRKFSATVANIEAAEFYTACCNLLCGYLDLEKSLVTVS